jgi:hypothetical protein
VVGTHRLNLCVCQGRAQPNWLLMSVVDRTSSAWFVAIVSRQYHFP